MTYYNFLKDYPLRPYHNGGGGYDPDRPQPGSNPGSPSKRVAFRDSPPQVRAIMSPSDDVDATDDEFLAIETDLKPKSSFPVIPVGHNGVALPEPPSALAAARAIMRSAAAAEPPLPPIEYLSNPMAMQLPLAMSSTKGYVFQQNYPALDTLKGIQALPAIASPTPSMTMTMQPFGNLNGDATSDDDYVRALIRNYCCWHIQIVQTEGL